MKDDITKRLNVLEVNAAGVATLLAGIDAGVTQQATIIDALTSTLMGLQETSQATATALGTMSDTLTQIVTSNKALTTQAGNTERDMKAQAANFTNTIDDMAALIKTSTDTTATDITALVSAITTAAHKIDKTTADTGELFGKVTSVCADMARFSKNMTTLGEGLSKLTVKVEDLYASGVRTEQELTELREIVVGMKQK